MLGIIGGTGLTQLAILEVSHRQVVRTPYGDPSGAVTLGRIGSKPVAFLARHCYGHTIPPHLVNYRANLWAMQSVGARDIVSVASVGAIRADLAAGGIVIPHQIIDYTWGRKSTYFEGPEAPVTHVDFTHPYCEALRARLIEAAAAAGQAVSDRAVYAATQGPRLESAAEIDRLERDGADIVGMTGMPEAALARELDLCYAAIAVVANPAAGRGASRDIIRIEDIRAVLQDALVRVRLIIEKLATNHGG